ncbi:MAG TPA: glycosyltransferase family 4 protein [Edaphocola sp.]|nr:glycosyltransferase family 4 protein [Edaphocola sp.]
MKLLFITNGINGSNGLERVLSIKTAFLADQAQYEVAILVLNHNHKNPFYNFNSKIHFYSIDVSGNPYAYYKSYKRGIQKTINDFQPNIISVCDDGLKGFFLPKLVKTTAKWIYERHASIALNTSQSLKGWIIKKLMFAQIQNFSKFVVLTPNNIKEWNQQNVIAIPNPLSFKSEISSSLEEPTIIAVGSHTWNKGYDLLIQAWEQLESKFPDWNVKIFGKMDPAEIFVNLTKEKQLKRIHFFEPTKDIQSEYLKSSLLVLPSRSEGFGMVLIEAMECGLPCVSFDCPSGPRDIIKNNEDGFLVAPQNVDALVAKIELLMENKLLRKQMGQKAKINVNRYSVENIMKEWLALYESVIRK